MMSPCSSDGIGQSLLHHIGAGLQNRGNTCFMNAVLQCLIHTVPLIQAIRSSFSPYNKMCKGDDAEFCSLCALQDLMDQCQYHFSRCIPPDVFVENLKKISPFFERYHQEDAHEFLQCMLDKLDSSFRTHELACTSSSTQPVIQQIFGGHLISKVKCCNCGHCSETFDPVLDLSLEINDVDRLEDALSSFTDVERVEDPDNAFTCQGCRSRVSVEKQIKLDQLPPVLIFNLKRFKNDGRCFEKIDVHVGYPMQLDLKPYVNSHVDGQLKYDLYALIVHRGSTPDSGHYYSFIRSSAQVWHKMDDSKVSRVSAEEVCKEDAYVLFYIKHGSSPWFSSLMQVRRKHDVFQSRRNKISPSSMPGYCPQSFSCTSRDSGNSIPMSKRRKLSQESVEKLIREELDVHGDGSSSDSQVNKREMDNSTLEQLSERDASKKIKMEGDAKFIRRRVTARSPLGRYAKEHSLDLSPAAKVSRPISGLKETTRKKQLKQMGSSKRKALDAYEDSSSDSHVKKRDMDNSTLVKVRERHASKSCKTIRMEGDAKVNRGRRSPLGPWAKETSTGKKQLKLRMGGSEACTSPKPCT